MKRMNQVRNPQDSRISTCLKRSWAFSGSNWLVLVMTWAIVASLTTFILLLGLELHHRKSSHRNFRWEKSGTKTSANPEDSEDSCLNCVFWVVFASKFACFYSKPLFGFFFRLTCFTPPKLFAKSFSVHCVLLQFSKLQSPSSRTLNWGPPKTLGVDWCLDVPKRSGSWILL